MPRLYLHPSVATLLLLAAVTPFAFAQPAAGPAAGTDPTWGRGEIRGELTGLDGNALIGISIVLLPGANPNVAYATSTDDRGRYAFDNLLSDRYEVRAEGQGFIPLFKKPVQVKPPFRAIVDIEMESGQQARQDQAGDEPTGTVQRVEGRFVDQEGEPVMEGSVIFRRLGHPEDVYYGRTDIDGYFVVTDLPAGIYDIATRSPGLIPLHLLRHPLPATESFHLRLVAPPYPLSFRGWLDDLLPSEVPLPPPFPHEVESEPGTTP
jgi:hypothetical protein